MVRLDDEMQAQVFRGAILSLVKTENAKQSCHRNY